MIRVFLTTAACLFLYLSSHAQAGYTMLGETTTGFDFGVSLYRPQGQRYLFPPVKIAYRVRTDNYWGYAIGFGFGVANSGDITQ